MAKQHDYDLFSFFIGWAIGVVGILLGYFGMRLLARLIALLNAG